MIEKGDKAMLTLARMQIILERNVKYFKDDRIMHMDNNKTLRECYDVIKKAKIPKKYLLAESLDESTNKV